MCKVKNHYHEYMKAESILRRLRIRSNMPGYECLKRGLVIAKVDGLSTEAKLLEEIKKQSFVGSAAEKKYTPIKQHMLEAIRSVSQDGDKTTIMEFMHKFVLEM